MYFDWKGLLGDQCWPKVLVHLCKVTNALCHSKRRSLGHTKKNYCFNWLIIHAFLFNQRSIHPFNHLLILFDYFSHLFFFFITTLTNFIRARSAGAEIIEFHEQTEIRCILTDRLIFVWFYRLLYVSWSKITGKLSRNDLHLRRYLSSDYFHPKEKSRRKKTDQEFPLFIFVTLHGIKTNSFRKSPLIVKLKSWSQMLLQKVQQSQQNLLLKRDTKINVTVTK